MKYTLSAIKQWIDYPHSAFELAEQLTLAGLETTIIQPAITPFKGITVGQILEIAKHPNAERLQVCLVTCGTENQTILCGATNVRQGLKVAVAREGAVLFNGLLIKPRTIRGVTSYGMLCSLSELGLQTIFQQEATIPGIWELPDEIEIGTDLWAALKLEEATLHTQVPPNRGDCLSSMGMAREIALLNHLPFVLPKIQPIQPTISETLPIQIHTPEACPRYIGRIIRNLDTKAKTPFWIRERLRRGDIRSVNVIVDITNYVLLEWGAPLHAFDLEQLTESIQVRLAQTNEPLTLIGNQPVNLTTDDLVIADAKGPQALAGIMGGCSSQINPNTTHIFLESAFFSPNAIAGRARHYGLMTDASYRFERGVDPGLCLTAIEQTTALLLQICGGQAGPNVKQEDLPLLPAAQELSLSSQKLYEVVGMELSESAFQDNLQRLGIFSVPPNPTSNTQLIEKQWKGIRPSWRFDLKQEVDVIEEIIRWHGYDKIPSQMPALSLCFPKEQKQHNTLYNLRKFFTNQGYYETIHYSFTSTDYQQALDPNTQTVLLENPISKHFNVLRTHLWPGLLSTVAYNQRHRQQPYAFFEIGTIFFIEAGNIVERQHVAGVATGDVFPEQWGIQHRCIDFFDVKHIVDNSLSQLSTRQHTYRPQQHAALHPQQSSGIYQENTRIGWLGALHPKLYSDFELTAPVYLFEFQLPIRFESQSINFKSFARFPSIRRDLAFWVSRNSLFDSIQSIVKQSSGEYLQEITLFDVYHPTEDSNQRSLALGLLWQHPERTLTEQEVDRWQAAVVHALKAELNVQMRE